MKKRIAIIGAGQAGLQLGIGLLKNKYKVTLISDRTPNDIRNGNVTSSQGIFTTALSYEKELGLNYWDDNAPKNTAVSFTIPNPDYKSKAIHWIGKTSDPYQSIDQRIKFSKWLETFISLKGNFILKKTTINDIDELAQKHDLTIIATGKNEVSQLFKKDTGKSIFEKPARKLSLIYVKNTTPTKEVGVKANIIPGIGEFFIMPGLTHNGFCEMMLFEGIPEGPFDCWNSNDTPKEKLEKALFLLKRYLPWEYERCKNATITDLKGTLTGAYIPTIKHPVAKLPSNTHVFGMGDTVVLNDPIAGQGANNASKCAKLYLEAILANRLNKFDKDWMQKTFNTYWQETAQWATKWSNLLLKSPAQHVIELLASAQNNQSIANYLANAFDNPQSLFPWIEDSTLTKRFIEIHKNKEEALHYEYITL